METTKLSAWIVICVVICGVGASRQQLYEGDICDQKNKKCENFRTCAIAHDKRNHGRRLPICSFNGTEVFVCCSEDLFDKTLDDSTFFSVSSMSNTVSVCEMYKNDICSGKSGWLSSAKNQGNVEQDLPFLALIGYGPLDSVEWHCGGALISSKYILSAAHCTYITVSGKKLEAKWVRLNKDKSNMYNIEVHFNHPEYTPPSQYNDIALYRLNKHVTFGTQIRPLCLPYPPYADYTMFYNVVSAGWGHLANDIVPGSGSVKVIDSGRCSLAGQPHQLPAGTDHESILCTSSMGGHNHKQCKNHFGGSALIVTDNLDNSRSCYLGTLVGILSIGKECEQKVFPGVYTNVSHYIPWITKKVWPDNTTYAELLWPKRSESAPNTY